MSVGKVSWAGSAVAQAIFVIIECDALESKVANEMA